MAGAKIFFYPILVCILILGSFTNIDAYTESNDFKGQGSTSFIASDDSKLSFQGSIHYIAENNYSAHFTESQFIELETALLLQSAIFINSDDSLLKKADILPYRLWFRYSNHTQEYRLGLQKINFGSATLFRPLMWFDQMNPKDPLQMTQGVWGALFRYYFQNNANIWFWGLCGNKELKGQELIKTTPETPEWGGRVQIPVPKGEAAITFHRRSIDTLSGIMENRIGLDFKLDVVVGFWAEASLTRLQENLGPFTQTFMADMGIDYTFDIGNGLTLIYEHVMASATEKRNIFNKPYFYSLFNASYPLNWRDRLNTTLYYDWKERHFFSFIQWSRDYENISLHCTGFWNPKESSFMKTKAQMNFYSGKGIQIQLVWNH